MKFVVGIDEAGRGPLAGPVAVGIVVAPANVDLRAAFPGVNDSKKLSEKKREEIYKQMKDQRGKIKDKEDTGKKFQDTIRYTVVFASAKVIDEKGISFAVRQSIYKGIRKLVPDPRNHYVLLDGLLKAPPEYSQQTIIRGDASEPIISLASIAAKVTRDRHMVHLSRKYPSYGFGQHKGYGTKAHLRALFELGPCAIHRKTYGRVGVPLL